MINNNTLPKWYLIIYYINKQQKIGHSKKYPLHGKQNQMTNRNNDLIVNKTHPHLLIDFTLIIYLLIKQITVK